jgi:hypothetical protein
MHSKPVILAMFLLLQYKTYFHAVQNLTQIYKNHELTTSAYR